MKYVASVDRACFPAHVSKRFDNKDRAVAWSRSQGGYNAVVYLARGWANVWSSAPEAAS